MKVAGKEIRKLNILYFAPCGLGEGVGGGARLRNMLDVLAQLDASVQLISYLPGNKFGVTRQRVSNRLNTTTISVKRSSPKIVKLFALGLVFGYGLRHVQRDCVLAHAPGIVSGFPALVLAKVFRKPLLIDHMDVNDPDTPGSIYKLVLRRSSVVFAISRFLENEARQIGCKNVVYLPVFVDADVFRPDAAVRTATRARLGIKESEIVIGYAGSFSHIEGVPFLLRAFKGLSGRYETRLVIVGGTNVPNSDNVAGLIDELGLKEKVVLVPPQPHAAMPQYLSAFDIAGSPKIDCVENRAANPIKIYEYMSMGLPMVLSAVGEVSNVIENGVDGFLVKPRDETELERTLERLMRNPALAKEAGERARRKITENYTQQVMLTRIADALAQVGRKIVPANSP